MAELPAPGQVGAPGYLRQFTTAELAELHETVYRDITARLDALDRMRWRMVIRPAWRAGIRAVRRRQTDLIMIGAEHISRIGEGR